MKISDLKEVKIDNVDGWGAVPNNQGVDYFGLRVLMRPSVFLDLADPLGKEPYDDIVNHIKTGGAIGAPFLIIYYPTEWEDKEFTRIAKIRSHEGRNRMTAILKVEGDVKVETHLFFSTFRYERDEEGRKVLKTGEVRARHLTPEIISHLNLCMYKEDSQDIARGPFFEPFK